MDRQVAVVIPAYNEEKSIAAVIRGVRALGAGYHVVVINDSSRDGTTRNAEAEGAVVIELPVNLGIGGAVQTGFKYAFEHGFDAAVQVDGDGQHPPDQIPLLVEPLFGGGIDIMVGSRFLGSDYRVTFMRGLGIKLISLFLRVFTGMSVRDATSGFRAVNRGVMGFFARTYPQDYPEPESLLLAFLKGFKVAEVPVRMNYRKYGTSSITPFRAAYYMTKVLLAMFIDLFREV
jgi:glycosyltransferase involved in cell wall biosynthesis